MRKASSWITARYHLGAIGRCVANWFEGFKLGCHEWVEQNIVAPEPVRKPYRRPAIQAVVMPWAPGAGVVCPDGERAEFWIAGIDDESSVEAYLAQLGVRRYVEVAR